MSLNFTVVGLLRPLPMGSDTSGAGLVSDRRPGGMGAPLAVLLARMGNDVRFVAGMSPGDSCPELRAPLVAEGVEVTPFLVANSKRAEPAPSGAGESAAEEPVEAEALEDLRPALAAEGLGSCLLIQMELQDAQVLEALAAAKSDSPLIALHLSPGRELPAEILGSAGLVIAREEEAQRVARCTGENVGHRGLLRRIGAYGPERAVVLGSAGGGATLFDGERFIEVESPEGGQHQARLDDLSREFVFTAALCTALAEEWRIDRALAMALKLSGLPPSGEGLFPELPSAEALETGFERQEHSSRDSHSELGA